MTTTRNEQSLATAIGDRTYSSHSDITRQMATISPEEQEILAFRMARNRERLRLQRSRQAEEATGTVKTRGPSKHDVNYDRAFALVLDIVTSGVTAQSIFHHVGEDVQTIVNFLDQLLFHGVTSDPDVFGQIVHLLVQLAVCADVVPARLVTKDVDYGTISYQADLGLQIRKGEYKHQTVRVKGISSISEDSRPWVKQVIMKDIVLWAQLSHPNIAVFYGVSDEPLVGVSASSRCLFSISPWADILLGFLAAFPETPRLPLVSDVIAGLEYLHSLGLVHGNLQRTNVLVSSAKRAMISDFTSSQTIGQSITTPTAEPLNFGDNADWDAPELLKSRARVTTESDVWSFGCVCYETLTGRVGFYQAKLRAELAAAFLQNSVDPISPIRQRTVDRLYKRRIWEAMEKCWNIDISGRPKATELSLFFANLAGLDDRPSSHSQDPILQGVKQSRAQIELAYARVYEVLYTIQRRLEKGKAREAMDSSKPVLTSPSDNKPMKWEDAPSLSKEPRLSPETGDNKPMKREDASSLSKEPSLSPETYGSLLFSRPKREESPPSKKPRIWVNTDIDAFREFSPMQWEDTILPSDSEPRHLLERPVGPPVQGSVFPEVSANAASAFRTDGHDRFTRHAGATQGVLAAADRKRIREQRFECTVCGNRFTTRQNLKNHMNSHLGISPYSCPYCSRTYRHSRSLNRHISKTHQGEGLSSHRAQGLGQSPLSQASREIEKEVEEEDDVLAAEGESMEIEDQRS